MAIDDIPNEIKANPDLGKSMAKWAALGAVLAIPIPFIGPIAGAVGGATYAYLKNKKRD